MDTPSRNPLVSRAEAIVIATYMRALGLTMRDVAELLRAHPRAVSALLIGARSDAQRDAIVRTVPA